MDRELLEAPRYSVASAARLAALNATRVRRWLRGYYYSYATRVGAQMRTGHSGPVVGRDEAADSPYASFLDLVDLLFVKQFVDGGISLQRVRKALVEVEEVTGQRHFAREIFFTDGRSIWLQIGDRGLDHGSCLLDLFSNRQWMFAPVIMQIAKKIDFEAVTGYAEKYYPTGKDGLVVVDPAISFGRPTIVRRGTPTEVIYDLFLGERENIGRVCSWMDLEPREVEAAVAFERRLAA